MGGFEPPNADTKNRCLRPLGYTPTEENGLLGILAGRKGVHTEREMAENKDGGDWCARIRIWNIVGRKLGVLRPNAKIGYLLILFELDFVNGVSFDNFTGK